MDVRKINSVESDLETLKKNAEAILQKEEKEREGRSLW